MGVGFPRGNMVAHGRRSIPWGRMVLVAIVQRFFSGAAGIVDWAGLASYAGHTQKRSRYELAAPRTSGLQSAAYTSLVMMNSGWRMKVSYLGRRRSVL